MHRTGHFAKLTAALVAIVVAFGGAAKAAEGDNFYVWSWGAPADVDPQVIPRIEPSDRIGEVGSEGALKYRLLQPNAFQVMMLFPAFDCDLQNFGAVNQLFYLTIKFKDIAPKPVFLYTGKGGCGFYGAGYVGSFGGAADGQWKEETLIIPRSMLRCTDGKTLLVKMNNIKAAIPVAALTLWSAAAKWPDVKARLAAAEKTAAAKHAALVKRLLPQFKDLGLPDPGPCPPYTAAETERGFRVFFPPISRELFANSQPQAGELADALQVYACPGETVSMVAAIRGLKELGQVTLEWKDPFAGARGPRTALDEAFRSIRWAVYSEQRIGSSWGKDYRVCPEQLVLGRAHEVGPERLEIAEVVFDVPAATKAGTFAGQLTLKSEKGGQSVVPVKVTVYPFKLEHPDHSTHGQFYYEDYADLNPFELRDMADHGMDTLVGGLSGPLAPGPDGKRQTDATRKAFAELKELGYRAPLIDGVGFMNGLLKDEKNRKQYAAIIAETLSLAKTAGFAEMGFFSVDEPHAKPLQALAKTACTWTQDVPGAKTYITSNPDAVKVLDPVLNYVCYNLTYLNPETLRSMKPYQKLMFYCPSIDVNPEYNRYRPGYYMFKINAYSSQYFAYFEFAEDPFCDLDGDNRDWNVAYPSMDSPYHDPTLEWEAMREGVYDYEFCYTLQALAERAKAKGKTTEAAQGQKVLDDVLAAVDVDGNKAGGPAIGI